MRRRGSGHESVQRRNIVTVSGNISEELAEQLAEGARPRPDYTVLAERLDARLLDHRAAMERLGRFGPLALRLLGRNVVLALALFLESSTTDSVLTDGEQVGLPYAALSRLRRRRPSHHMIVHIMSVRKKSLLFRALRLRTGIDTYFVYSNRQAQVLRDLGVDDDRIVLTSFMVDTDFFDPAAESVPQRRMICSAGLEYRDYATLVEAVRGLDVEVVIAAASPWSKRTSDIAGAALPTNVTTTKLDLAALRRLYAEAAFVVMPLVDVEFQAGVTTILEAMSMGRAVVCSRTRGQTDVIEDGVTGMYVPPADVESLRVAIERLLDEPDLAAELGTAARGWVVETADVERYADRLADAVSAAGGGARQR